MDTQQSIADIHRGREVIYSSFSKLFLDVPTDELFTNFLAMLPSLKIMAETSGIELLAEGYKGLETVINSRALLNDDGLKSYDEELLKNYTSLFCLGSSVPLSASVYLSAEQLINSELTGDVNAIYTFYGFQPRGKSNEPADHLSHQLMFLSHMASLSAEAYDNGDSDSLAKLSSAQSKFIKKYVAPWLPLLIEALLSNGVDVYFYTSATYFISGFIVEDISFLES